MSSTFDGQGRFMNIFNYNTLETSLCKETRSFTISLNRSKNSQKINQEMLFELESLINWLSSKIEIKTVLLTSNSEIFCGGLDYEDWKIKSSSDLFNFTKRFTKLSQSLSYLPQTVICDLKKRVDNEGIELALGADLRFSTPDFQINFDFLKNGLMPSSSLFEKFYHQIGMQFFKNYIFSPFSPSTEQLIQQGVLTQIYLDKNFIKKQLLHSSKLSDIARLQAKMAFKIYESELEKERIEKLEELSLATMFIEDWKKESHKDFLAAREIKSTLRRQKEIS